MNIQKYGRALLETSAEGSTTKHLEQDLKRSERYMKSSVFYTVETLGTETSLIRTVSNVPTKFSYIFFDMLTID